MFRPIRVDHTNCLQVPIKTHSFDHLIDDKNMGKMREMARDLSVVVFSDGWTTVNHHPIVNIIMGVRSLHTLRASIDTMGQEKRWTSSLPSFFNTSMRLVRTGYSCPVLHRHVSISCQSRVGSTQTGETGSVRSLSRVSCVLTPTSSWNNVWRCMRPV